MVRTLTWCIRASRTTPSPCSTTSVRRPRRPRSPANEAPTGPPPTISTSTSKRSTGTAHPFPSCIIDCVFRNERQRGPSTADCRRDARIGGKPELQMSIVPIEGLHHYAYRCRDAEETRAFYEDLLGLPLAHIIEEDYVPSTGEYCPYVHIFFRMADGSYIAFFDLGDDTRAEPSANTP